MPADVRVVLGDSMGEMAGYYGAADVAFVGGSLVPLGGQNLIEAIAMGAPVLVGPHTFNFADAADGGGRRRRRAARRRCRLRCSPPLPALLGDAPRREAMRSAPRASWPRTAVRPSAWRRRGAAAAS